MDGKQETVTGTETGVGTGTWTSTRMSMRAGMGARIEVGVEGRKSLGTYEVVIEARRKTREKASDANE